MDLTLLQTPEQKEFAKKVQAEAKEAREKKEKRDKEQSDADREKAAEDKRLLKIQTMQLSAKAKGISEEEQIRQDEFDFSRKAKKRMLASELKKSGGVATKKTKKMDKALKEEGETEDARREKQSMTFLEKIAKNTKGLGKGIKDFVGKTPTGLKAILAGVAFFALAKFLQSGTWKKIVGFIVDNIVPLLESFYDDVMKFDGTLTGKNGLLSIIKNNFLVLLSALAILKPKLVFNLLKGAFMLLYSSLKFIASEVRGNAFKVKGAKTKAMFGKMKIGFKGIMSGLGRMAASSLKLMMSMFANPVGLLVLAVIAAIALVVIYWDDIKAMFIRLGKKFKELGGITGIFELIVAKLKDAFITLINGFKRIINRFNPFKKLELDEVNNVGNYYKKRKKINDKIEDDENEEAFKKDNKGMSRADAFEAFKEGMKGQEENAAKGSKSLDSIDSKTPDKKILSFEEMTMASMDKLVGLMNGKDRPNVTQNNVNNSKNNNAKNVTSPNTPVTDVSGMRLVNGQYVA